MTFNRDGSCHLGARHKYLGNLVEVAGELEQRKEYAEAWRINMERAEREVAELKTKLAATAAALQERGFDCSRILYRARMAEEDLRVAKEVIAANDLWHLKRAGNPFDLEDPRAKAAAEICDEALRNWGAVGPDCVRVVREIICRHIDSPKSQLAEPAAPALALVHEMQLRAMAEAVHADRLAEALKSVRDTDWGDNPETFIAQCEDALTRYETHRAKTHQPANIELDDAPKS